MTSSVQEVYAIAILQSQKPRWPTPILKDANDKWKGNFLCQNEFVSSKKLLCFVFSFVVVAEAYGIAWNLKTQKSTGNEPVTNKY